ncbi:MAG: hypothetical protein B6U89_06240 [Desulfurococcales archaeon ex4484_58]|nr:MAG: hypothetical protein B6U89_06240 [Desulfurococcales archaeon ex4484_58]
MSTIAKRRDNNILLNEILEGIREERRKLLERYGVNSVNELCELIMKHRLDENEVFLIKNRLEVLDKMETIIYREMSIRNKLLYRIKNLFVKQH